MSRQQVLIFLMEHINNVSVEPKEYQRFVSKGRIDYIEIGDKIYSPEQFGDLGITRIHFMTPAHLDVKHSVDVLVDTYKQLGETISEGDSSDTMRKVRIREDIAKQLHKRGINLHDVM